MNSDRRSPSFWVAFVQQLRLAWRLFWDGRVPLLPKLVPLAAILYILSPIDLLPDVLVGLGQLDDVALFLIALQIFVMICPPEIVRALRQQMTSDVVDGEWRRTDSDPASPPRIPKSDQ